MLSSKRPFYRKFLQSKPVGMSGKNRQRSDSLEQFKNIVQKFSGSNGRIKLASVSAFRRHIQDIDKLSHIGEALRTLDESGIRVIEKFFDQDGWKLINEWLRKIFKHGEGSDKELAVRIHQLIFKIMTAWLNRPRNVLGDTTRKIIEQYNSTDEGIQNMIEEFRSKWEIESCPKLQDKQGTKKSSKASGAKMKDHEPIARRLRNSRQSDENTSSPIKRSTSTTSSSPANTLTCFDNPQPRRISRRLREKRLKVNGHSQVNYGTISEEKSRFEEPIKEQLEQKTNVIDNEASEIVEGNASGSDWQTTDHYHACEKSFDKVGKNGPYTCLRRIEFPRESVGEEEDNFDMDTADYKLRITVHNHYGESNPGSNIPDISITEIMNYHP